MVRKFYLNILFSALVMCVSTANAGHISVTNRTGFDLNLLVFGESCRIFDDVGFQYVPCKEKFLKDGDSFSFLQQENSAIKLQFSSSGWQFICRKNYPEHVKMQQSIFIDLDDRVLAPSLNYAIELLPSWGYFPTAFVDCEVTTYQSCQRRK